MAVTFDSSAQAGAGANLQNISITIPAGASVGMFALLAWSYANTTVGTNPSGWTQVGSNTDDGSVRSAVFYRILQGGDPGASVALNTNTIQRHTAVMSVYAGVDPTDPVDQFATALETGTSTSHAEPTTAATSVANCVGVHVFSERGTNPVAITAPSGTTKRENPLGPAAAGSTSTAIADNVAPLGLGATVGGGSWTNGVSTASAVMWALAIAQVPVVSNWTYGYDVVIGG